MIAKRPPAHFWTLIQNAIICTLILFGAGACASQPQTATTAARAAPTLASAPITPAADSYRQSTGGGQPRSTGYWLLWNTCAEGNQSAMAKSNGGSEAGWILMDDLLIDPGVLIGALDVTTCPQGVSVLRAQDLSDGDHGNDPAYTLAAQLLAAQLNMAAGAASCPAAEEAVQGAQLLLISLDFNSTGIYLGPPAGGEQRETALILADQLACYNAGSLCIP